MTTLIAIYLAVGFFSYWPLIWGSEPKLTCEWYHWIAAWAIWCFVWPYQYICDAWYWWRAKK